MNLNLVKHSKPALIMVNIILGSILLYSYYYYIKYGGVTAKRLWGDAYPYRKYMFVTMILATIGYLAVLLYSLFFAKTNKTVLNLAVCQILIICISMLWLPITIMFLKSSETINKRLLSFAAIVVLFLVALASIKQILIVEKLEPLNKNFNILKKIAVIGAFLFAFQTFIIDFLVWDVAFFLSNYNLF